MSLAPAVLDTVRAPGGNPPNTHSSGPSQGPRQPPPRNSQDELQTTPAIVGRVRAGHVESRTVAIPSTTLLSVTLFSNDARLSLKDPRGRLITPRDTSELRGVICFGLPGFQGFQIREPQPGTWTVRIDASRSASATQDYGCFVEFATPWTAWLSTAQVVRPGDPIRVRAQVTNGAVDRSDVQWRCSALRNDDPAHSSLSLQLFDDGLHDDARAKDGVFGGSTIAAEAGFYRFVGVATVPGIGEITATSTSEAVPFQDLSVAPSDIRFSNDRPTALDSVTIFATAHNHSAIPANDVEVTIRALWRGEDRGLELGSSKVDLPSGGKATIRVGWQAWEAVDSIRIQAEVSPDVLDEENYANNVASRWIVVQNDRRSSRNRSRPGNN